MCGRFAQATALQKLEEMMDIVGQFQTEPRYNIAPSSLVTVLRQNKDLQNEYAMLKWGLIPHWSRETKIGYKLFNAKAETLLDKPSFRGPFRYRRCIVPVDGFYEWTEEQGHKQPWYIKRRDEQPLLLAGLWDDWETPEQNIESFTIITRDADEQIRPIHSRMPVMLKPQHIKDWLDRDNQTPGSLYSIMDQPVKLAAYKVSTLVNSPRNDTADLIKAL